MMLFRSAVKQIGPAQRLPRDLHVPAQAAERDVERLAPAPVAQGRRAATTPSPIRKRAAVGRRQALDGRACWSMRAARRRSRRRPSTATSATGRTRSRPTARSGAATTAASWCACSAAPGDPATHLENRVGEPAANPYLYMACQIVTGLDGLERKPDPGPSADTPYEAKAPLLPRTLAEALAALRKDKALRAGFGDFFVDYYLKLKQAEIDRFDPEVSDWEQREYFRSSDGARMVKPCHPERSEGSHAIPARRSIGHEVLRCARTTKVSPAASSPLPSPSRARHQLRPASRGARSAPGRSTAA